MAYSKRESSRNDGYGGGSGTGQFPKTSKAPYPMPVYFLPQDTYGIHRDVLRIRIRQCLGQSATCWYAMKDNRPGHFYRAGAEFTQHQLDDLIRETNEYVSDPDGYQRRLDQGVWDNSQWTDPGEPGASTIRSVHASRRPTGSSHEDSRYYQNPGHSVDQPGYGGSAGRGKQRQTTGDTSVYSSSGDPSHHGYDARYGAQATAGRGGYNGTFSDARTRHDQPSYGTYSAGAQNQAYGQDAQLSGYDTTSQYGNSQYGDPYASSNPAQGYMQGSDSGAYADNFLQGMSQAGYVQDYQSTASGSSGLSSQCPRCAKTSDRCKCQLVNS